MVKTLLELRSFFSFVYLLACDGLPLIICFFHVCILYHLMSKLIINLKTIQALSYGPDTQAANIGTRHCTTDHLEAVLQLLYAPLLLEVVQLYVPK